MLERMAGVLARLRTFELIEGGRRPALPLSISTTSTAAVATAAAPLLPLGSAVIRPGDGYVNGAGSSGVVGGAVGVGGGGGNRPVARGKENNAEGGEANENDGDGSCGFESGYDDADSDSTAAAHVVDDVAAEIMISDVSDENGSGGSEYQGGDGSGAVLSEVARWLQFRTADLVSFVGGALQVGDVQAASVAWRRHGRTDRGAARTSKTAAAAVAGISTRAGGAVGEGNRMEVALPGQLVTLPAVAPPVLLGAWLRDEVLPWLDVAGVIAVSFLWWWKG